MTVKSAWPRPRSRPGKVPRHHARCRRCDARRRSAHAAPAPRPRRQSQCAEPGRHAHAQHRGDAAQHQPARHRASGREAALQEEPDDLGHHRHAPTASRSSPCCSRAHRGTARGSRRSRNAPSHGRTATAKNQRTAGCRSTGPTGSCAPRRAPPAPRARPAAAGCRPARMASVPAAQPGKCPMPKRSNHAPAKNTVTRKPAEPHSRMRP